MQAIRELLNPSGNRRLRLILRTDGTFGFRADERHQLDGQWVEAPGENSRFATADAALRTARNLYPWVDEAVRPASYTLDWIREFSGSPSADWITPIPVVTMSVGESTVSISAARVLSLRDGMYLVESIDAPGRWSMGCQSPSGSIECWAEYRDLFAALEAL